MSKKITVSVAIAITIIAMTVTFAITWLVSMTVFDRTVSSVTQLQAQYTKIAEIDTYVRKNYYGTIDENTLYDRISAGYIAGLNDRYSAYYTESDYADMLARENGSLVGVGLVVQREADGTYRIARVYEDSPAARAGVKANMAIVAVDGAEARSFAGLSALNRALWGDQGTDLELKCTKGGVEESFTIRRSNYTAPTVERRMLGGYAYIRLYGIGQSTFSDFDFEVRQARSEGAKGLVFDLRGLNGQNYSQVYQMINVLCPRGTVAKSENLNGTTTVLATSDENYVDLPMVCIVDGGTAASAELFAVSLRDLAGAQLVGVHTAGNGTLLAQPYRLQDGSAITIPVARLLTGRDESFDGTGLIPDIEVLGDDVTAQMLIEPQPEVDTQILRAFEAIRAMVRERGGDPGTGMDPPASSSAATAAPPASTAGADDSSSVPEDGSAASGGTASGDSASGGANAGAGTASSSKSGASASSSSAGR